MVARILLVESGSKDQMLGSRQSVTTPVQSKKGCKAFFAPILVALTGTRVLVNRLLDFPTGSLLVFQVNGLLL